ncbi:betaine-aldehyde dehydrogenase [Bradyrhizobium macuxiense]|uniref:Betaine-aldehyde dehydrogenase n=1 Tax=Bradyrhizobium macuxiense TaxID=1755647 RepID=A0A560KXF0_9BRAD|nr:aldehyde dehydrogenase family protein [Bradyrhizobium macuxiense]TWB87827.1 betaine-aldehyde dehydrogenase [Bradyrhizobium macuxiense]
MPSVEEALPRHKGIFYGGSWRDPVSPSWVEIIAPATGKVLTTTMQASASDVPLAVAAARNGFDVWRGVPPLERAGILREMARLVRNHAREFALLDAHNCGSPLRHLDYEADRCGFVLEYFAGLVTEMKGHSVPQGFDSISFSVREPYGVVARIAASNHPLLFTVGKAAAVLAAGNSIVIKPPHQAPLSALRSAEIFDGLLPPGVFNVLTGGREVGAALASDPGVAMVGLVGGSDAGRSVLHAAADTIKRTIMELSGKNALIALPDADPERVAAGMVRGMNYTWCGQSMSSPTRAFVHADICDAVLARLPAHLAKVRPGLPEDPQTTMGSLIDRTAFEKVKSYIAIGIEEGAKLIYGGHPPTDPALSTGYFMLPTIFADVTMNMRIARDEIFGPVQAVLKWTDEAEMLRQVNELEFGLSCSVWTRDVTRAHRIVSRVEAGFCWINEASRHAQGSPFGGYKQSGLGREECLEELLAFTQEKNIIIGLGS